MGICPLMSSFANDLTFLTGLNGSGKTTALRLLMALLTPNFDELALIMFTKAVVTIHDGSREMQVSAGGFRQSGRRWR